MKLSVQTKKILFQLSALLILIATVLYSFDTDVAKYMLIVGVIGFGASVLANRYQGESIRGKRLFSIQLFAVLFMAVSAYLMYVNKNTWVVTMLIAAVLTLYSSIVLSYIEKEENRK